MGFNPSLTRPSTIQALKGRNSCTANSLHSRIVAGSTIAPFQGLGRGGRSTADGQGPSLCYAALSGLFAAMSVPGNSKEASLRFTPMRYISGRPLRRINADAAASLSTSKEQAEPTPPRGFGWICAANWYNSAHCGKPWNMENIPCDRRRSWSWSHCCFRAPTPRPQYPQGSTSDPRTRRVSPSGGRIQRPTTIADRTSGHSLWRRPAPHCAT